MGGTFGLREIHRGAYREPEVKKGSNLRPAVFIDRDGTLNRVVYNADGLEDSPFRVEDLELLPGAGDFTRRVREAGYFAVLATNQPGVAKGSITIAGLELINQRLIELLGHDGGGLDQICYCPHHPMGRVGNSSPFIQVCDCRKPAPGMLMQAAKDMEIDLSRSWMVGDKLLDVQAGQAAGCKTILVRSASAKLPEIPDHLSQVYTAEDLGQALEIILKVGAPETER